MEILILCIAALIASLLTFFSGFGLGTILTPVFAIFFPAEIAIALTGVVHFLNNIFKLMLVGKHADKQVVIRFGLPAIFAALLGAFLLLQISELEPILSYTIGNKLFHVTPIKLIVAILIIFFSLHILRKFSLEKTSFFSADCLVAFLADSPEIKGR